jgi:pilus assembly protein Flp/PilA
MLKAIKTFLQDQSGATAIEYGLIAGAVALTIIPAIGDVNSGVLRMYGVIANLFNVVM